MKKNTPEIFWSRVDKKTQDECWLWKGLVQKSTGYGQMCYLGKPESTHRLAFLFYYGKLEETAWICHKCNVRLCVNPFHLYKGTPHSNTMDSVIAGTHRVARKTHCKNGHDLSLHGKPRGTYKRECQICAKKHKQEWNRKLSLKRAERRKNLVIHV